jgi:predicted dehydrogenase
VLSGNARAAHVREEGVPNEIAWGMVGGGEESQIGSAHRIAARLDGLFRLSAGALDIDPDRARAFATGLGIAEDRAYASWQDMLAGEAARPDRVGLVTVATPNATHYEISRAFLEAGFHVLCEKPMTMTVEEAHALRRVAEANKSLLAVNFGYSGYPMVRQARAMVEAGDLGAIRLVVAEFAHGFHADAGESDNPRMRWRYDPQQAGVSSVLSDAGIHALHMVGFVTGQRIDRLRAEFHSHVSGRALEDDAHLSLLYSGGTRARLWTSAIAVGQKHGLNIRIFGEKGGLTWRQEQPNQLAWTPLNGRTEIMERGDADLYPEAVAGSRIALGHPEGLLVAFANLYRDIHTAIRAGDTGPADTSLIPSADDGVEMVRAVHAAARSASNEGQWIDL